MPSDRLIRALGLIALAGCLAAAMTGCSTERSPGELYAPSEENVLVVDAALIVNRPFPAVRLSRTQSPDELYLPEDSAEPGALIRIAGAGAVVEYAMDDSAPGYYTPLGDTLRVRPETEYRLEVTTTDGEIARGLTFTPPVMGKTVWLVLNERDLSIERTLVTFDEAGDSSYFAPENQLVYSEGLIEVRVERDDGPGFQVGIFSLDLDSDFVIDPEFLDDEDFDQFRRNGSSPPFFAEDGALRLPWFAIYFEGRYKLKVYSIDHNWYDLIRSTPEFGGGGGFGGLTGDSFERPLFSIEGGIGLFGSASVDSIGFYVHPRP